MPGCFVITGAGRGLGRAIAQRAAREGYGTALLSRTKSELVTAAESLQSLGPQVTYHPIDLRDARAVSEVFNEIQEAHPHGIRSLINCAGTWAPPRSAWELSAKDLQEALDLNFFSAFHCIQAVLSSWPTRQPSRDLSIVNIGATASLRGSARLAPFAVSKTALRTLSQSLARELGPQGIHVAHVVVDGHLDNTRTRGSNPELEPDRFIALEAAATEVLHVALQERSCWTFEWDIRPYNEPW